MGKGKQASLGTETINQNGYTMVKTSTGWRLKHHIVAEAKLGRPLEKNERVSFGEGGRQDFSHDNIIVTIKQVRVSQTYDKRLQAIEDRVMLFVEEAPDRTDALDAVLDVLNDARLAHGFARINKGY